MEYDMDCPQGERGISCGSREARSAVAGKETISNGDHASVNVKIDASDVDPGGGSWQQSRVGAFIAEPTKSSIISVGRKRTFPIVLQDD